MGRPVIVGAFSNRAAPTIGLANECALRLMAAIYQDDQNSDDAPLFRESRALRKRWATAFISRAIGRLDVGHLKEPSREPAHRQLGEALHIAIGLAPVSICLVVLSRRPPARPMVPTRNRLALQLASPLRSNARPVHAARSLGFRGWAGGVWVCQGAAGHPC